MRTASQRMRMIGLLLAAGCSATDAPSAQPAGPSRAEVCEEFIVVAQQDGTMTSSHEVSVSHGTGTRSTQDDQAAQHRAIAKSMRRFAEWARTSDDAAVAEIVAAIGAESDRVLRKLRGNTDGAKAQDIADSLSAHTAKLYGSCNAEVYREALRRSKEPLREGPCAAPDAPKLRGDVFVYGGGEDFTDARCVLVHGRPHGDGCTFTDPIEGPLTADNGPIASVEVATNHTTCTSLYVVGRPSS